MTCNPYDLARVLSLRASSQFRIALDTNRYSAPVRYAAQRLTVKAFRTGSACTIRTN